MSRPGIYSYREPRLPSDLHVHAHIDYSCRRNSLITTQACISYYGDQGIPSTIGSRTKQRIYTYNEEVKSAWPVTIEIRFKY